MTIDDFPPVPEGEAPRKLGDVPPQLRPLVPGWISQATLSGVRGSVQEAAYESFVFGMTRCQVDTPIVPRIQVAAVPDISPMPVCHEPAAIGHDGTARMIPAGLLARVAFWELIAINQGIRQAVIAAISDAQHAVAYARWPQASPELKRLVPMPFMGMRDVNVVAVCGGLTRPPVMVGNVIPLFPGRGRG